MIILHGGFDRGFFIWGESSFTRTGLHNLRRMRRVGGDCIVDHIWDPGVARMIEALGDIGFSYKGNPEGEKIEIELPTFAEKYPIPASPLLGEIPSHHLKREAGYGMRRWRVDSLPLGVLDLVDLLPLITAGAPISKDGCLLAHGVMVALDLCYVVECCRFAVSLLEKGRFLPDIREMPAQNGDAKYEAIWRPLLTGEDAEYFGRLARMMPPAIRSFARLDDVSQTDALCMFFEHIMDGLIRQAWAGKYKNSGVADESTASQKKIARALAKGVAIREESLQASQAERRKRGKLVNALNPHALWARSLGWLGDTEGLSISLESIYSDVRSWWRRFEWFAQAPFKLCVTLRDSEERSGAWRIEYAVQYLKTGAEIPAADVWTFGGDTPEERDGISGNYMRRYLLLLLGRIGGIVPAVMRSLETHAPTGCELSLYEASDFLCRQAKELIASGVGVRYPEWWRESSIDRLTIRGRKIEGTVDPRIFDDMMLHARAHLNETELLFKWELALDGGVLSPEEEGIVLFGELPLVHMRGRWIFIHPEHLAKVCLHMSGLPTELLASEAVRLAVRDPYIDGFTDAPELEQIYDSLRAQCAREALVAPDALCGALRPYQERGYSWLSFLSRLGLGACLADDMGLGKTIQTLAMIQHHRDNGEMRPALLVCPTSVIENWRLEIEKFFPEMTYYIHHGRARLRGEEFGDEIHGASVVITSYSLIQRDAPFLTSVQWLGVVLDEAQNIKNPDTYQARVARSIRADWRVVLTGTPIENHVGDLWSIMEFLMPGMLGSRRYFKSEYLKPIQENRDVALMENLKRQVAPFIMRRMKTDDEIAPDLPKKIETKVYCGLKKEQAKLYADITGSLARELAGQSGIKRRGVVLAALTRLKQVCNHPALAERDGEFSPARSSKLERTLTLAEEMFETGDKALIFTQYVEMGHILKSQLQERFGKEVLFLHGAVFKDARDAMVRRFQESQGPQFFVLSLKAGGVGLNLTGANHVIMYDRWWNPAVEAQAIDRAYRIGQSRNVQVHIFCCRGTLEERIDELLFAKKELASQIVDTNDNWITEMSDRELHKLLALSPKAVES